MEVTIDDQFPRVIQYQWLSNGKMMYGQEDAISTVNINGVSYTPTVQFAQTELDKATYTLTFQNIDVVMTVVIEVVENVMNFKVTNIQENGSTLVKTVEFPKHSLISIRDTQIGAQETGVDVRSWNSTKEEYNLLANKAADAAPVGKSYVILNTSELAASIYSNAFEFVPDSSKNNPDYNDYEQHYYYQTVAKSGYKKMGVWSYPWTYREISGNVQEIVELPYVKVAITPDANGDGVVDWQDGGIAYRKIMTLPYGHEIIPKVTAEIAHNTLSMTQWPFLRTLDMIKKFYLYTDGFGQLFQTKGSLREGSAEPDYGIGINKRAGGASDLNKFATEAAKYNTYVGIHINNRELNPESQYYSYEKSSGTICYEWSDPLECVKRYDDAIDNGPTGLAARIAELRRNVPNLKWTYIDVYTGNGYSQWKLAHELNRNGFMIGTEFSGALDRYSIWNHVTQNESKVERFLRNHVTDEFMYDPILLGSRHASAMGYGNDKGEDQGETGLTIQDQMNIFFTNNLLSKYMQNYEIMKMDVDQTLNQATNVMFQGGLTGQVVDPGTVTNDGTYVTNNPKVELRRNGALIATYQKEFKKKIVATTTANYHGKTVTPQLTQYLLPWDPQTETKLYHWNSVGGNTTWTLPASWAGVTAVDLYKLTDTGKVPVGSLPVVSGQLTINAAANTPYVVYKSGKGDTITPVTELNFGEGGLVKDPGFDSRLLNNWNVSSTSGNTSHVSIQTNEAGDTYLQVKGNNGADATVAQTIAGLIPGKTYQASVWAEVKNGRTLTVGVKDYGGTEVTNTMTKSNVPNKYFNTMRSSINSNKLGSNNMQRIWVNFTVPAGHSSATFYMKASQVAGSATAEADLDDVRIVELDAPAPQGNHYFFEDFESNQEGHGPFIYMNGANHLSELHEGFTNNTINGRFSLKMTDNETSNAELERTVPTNLKLQPNTTYTVSFPYRMKYPDSFKFALTSGYGTGMVDLFNDTLDNAKYFYSKTFTTGSADDYSFRFIKKSGGPAGVQELIIDDFTVDLGAVAPPAETADQTFDDGQIGGWVVAYGNGQIQAADGQLSMKTDRYDTIALDRNTADIADGDISFTVTPQSGSSAGAVIRYTSPASYTQIRYDSATGWTYRDPQGHSGIINKPGVSLTQGVPHKVKLTYTGSHYKLKVDNILLFDGDVPELKTTAGRTGFIVRNKTSVYVDDVTLANMGPAAGSTPIIPTPPAEAPQSAPGTIVLDSYDDSYVRDSSYANTNYGSSPTIEVKWDGNAGYSRESYLKFDLSGVTSAVYAAKVKLNLVDVGETAPNQVVELVTDNTWTENTITWNNKPASSGIVLATFPPTLGAHEFDVTSQVQQALAADKQLSLKIRGAVRKVGGAAYAIYGAFENTQASNRPVLELSVPIVDKSAPVTTDDAPKDWVNSDVTVTLTASDSGSGVAGTYYSVDGGAKQQGTSVTITAEGSHTLSYWSVDKAGNVEAPHTVAVQLDKTAPTIRVVMDKPVLWPANHQMVTVSANVYSEDRLSGIKSVYLESITSNEPDSGSGEGNTPNDIQGAEIGTFDTVFMLRAERSGKGSGRTYTITYTAIDYAGNKISASATVAVPHDQSGN
ncbi:endo-alpha-N-acetylgalactosaminidase family protein [Gordoniibacillus kamchatkensis]|nr:endo-alpha-N-acetylgalactosaminidase family protein [Paenibacillus sp. VKM B-2647]